MRSILYLCLAAVIGSAQDRFHLFTTDDGLPQDSVLALLQARDGYLWFTTYRGMVRFDGVRFRVFDQSNTPMMGTNFVAYNLMEDRDGDARMALRSRTTRPTIIPVLDMTQLTWGIKLGVNERQVALRGETFRTLDPSIRAVHLRRVKALFSPTEARSSLMNEIEVWIADAIRNNNLDVQELPKEEAKATLAHVVGRFVRGQPRSWWLGLAVEARQTSSDGVPISQIVPGSEEVFFIPETEARDPSVFRAAVSQLEQLIADCPFFEYYLVAIDYSWLVIESDHNVYFLCGELPKCGN